MYCIIVTGIPAAGKSSMSERISGWFNLPVVSKDSIKEQMFDSIGFNSREEKVRLGKASMSIMYYFAEQLMKQEQPFILENNFESVSRDGLFALLDKYSYKAITIVLTGNYECIYNRFVERDKQSGRHRGHVVNDFYPEKGEKHETATISFEDFVSSIRTRGMDTFTGNASQITVDTSNFDEIDFDKLKSEIEACILKES